MYLCLSYRWHLLKQLKLFYIRIPFYTKSIDFRFQAVPHFLWTAIDNPLPFIPEKPKELTITAHAYWTKVNVTAVMFAHDVDSMWMLQKDILKYTDYNVNVDKKQM